jgi:hypothetical protein
VNQSVPQQQYKVLTIPWTNSTDTSQLSRFGYSEHSLNYRYHLSRSGTAIISISANFAS